MSGRTLFFFFWKTKCSKVHVPPPHTFSGSSSEVFLHHFRKASKASTHQDASRSESALRLTYSFYVSTVIGAIEQAGAIQEEFLAILVPFLTKGLKSSHLDYKVATYMVLSQLCAHAKIDDQLLHPLIRTTCKVRPQS